uniref:DUF2971 domain-containing protein n=1 Tax=Candidatus Kentrum sp. LFY TaxID=2126342 RepID=A0A450WNP1_9GAMM|nr:MAG: Protein of unknown function (DUF2971) [Candidatus Kentron sp. LFY]
MPYHVSKGGSLESGEFKFVHYTSAESAMHIIKNRQVWMRNAQCMNDFMELEHGYECLIEAYNSDPEGKKFQAVIESAHPGLPKDIAQLFDSWMPHLRNSVFIACLSEHPPDEDNYGRLSMWRAYGGNQPVALVLNNTPFLSDTSLLGVFSTPVIYQEVEDFRAEFGKLASRLEQAKDILVQMGRDNLRNTLFELIKIYVLGTKHPGFSEEREWRVFYTPELGRSEHVESEIVSVKGVPQEVHKVPLRDIPEIDFHGAIPDLLHRVIIGPSDQQVVMGQTFKKLLTDAGCEDVDSKVHYSGIPLR